MDVGDPPRALLLEFARYTAAMSYVLAGSDIGTALSLFRSMPSEVREAVRESLPRFVGRWGKNGFDEKGRLQHPTSGGRPRLISQEEGELMAKELVGGYVKKGQQQYYRTRREFWATSKVAQPLTKRKGNKGKVVSATTLDRSLRGSHKPVISKKKPRQLPPLTAEQKNLRFELAKKLKRKKLRQLSKTVFIDYTSLGVGKATAEDRVWCERGRGRPVLTSTAYAKTANYVTVGGLGCVALGPGTIGPFRRAEPGCFKVRVLAYCPILGVFRTNGSTSGFQLSKIACLK